MGLELVSPDQIREKQGPAWKAPRQCRAPQCRSEMRYNPIAAEAESSHPENKFRPYGRPGIPLYYGLEPGVCDPVEIIGARPSRV